MFSEYDCSCIAHKESKKNNPSFRILLIFRYENSLYMIRVINKQGTNHSGDIKSSWCPVRKGINNSFFRVIGSPQNLPNIGVRALVIPIYAKEYKKYGSKRDLHLRFVNSIKE